MGQKQVCRGISNNAIFVDAFGYFGFHLKIAKTLCCVVQ